MSATLSGDRQTGPHDFNWRWKRERASAWWQLQSEWKFQGLQAHELDKGGKYWSALQFRLTEKKQNELQGVYPPADQPACRYEDISSCLQNLLEYIISFQIRCSGICRVGELIHNVPEMVENPAAIIEHFEISDLEHHDSADLQTMVDAVKAGKLRGLKYLRLQGIGTNSSHAALAEAMAETMASGHLPMLEKLSLRCIEFDQHVCEAYAKAMTSGNLIALKELYFEECPIDDDGAKALARGFESGVKNLVVLSLSGTRGTNGMIAIASGQLPKLKTLSLRDISFDQDLCEAYAKAITAGNFIALKEMNLESCRIDDDGAKTLARGFESGKLKNLVVLRLCGTCGTICIIAMASGQLPKLETLSLWNIDFDQDVCKAYAKAITSGNLIALKEMDFSCQIDDDGAKALARGLESGKLKNLAVLKLRGNLGTNGMIAMASGQLPKLEKLRLSDVRVDVNVCEAYAKAITSGNLIALKRLNFLHCQIDDDGAEALARGLESGKLKNLAVLKLRNNEIGNDGMSALARSLEVGGFFYLSHLNVTGNPWSDESVPSIAHAIQSGNLRSLTKLHLVHEERPGHVRSKEMVEVLLEALLSQSAPKVSDLTFDWSRYPQLGLRYEQLLLRNGKHRKIMAELGDGVVLATVGKVYLCGDPKVGKTTLRESLGRSLLKSLLRMERRRREIERTRGIDVSELTNKSPHHEGLITLMLWDMAGQNEYHLIHNSFFPDLETEEAETIMFLVMCRSDNMETAREQLRYWLKFISSSVNKGVHISREVQVVVNRTNGDRHVLKNISQWQEMVDYEGKKFHGVLKLSSPLFVADARQRKAVGALKHHLIESAALKLKNINVPDICHFLQTHLGNWSQEKMQFPVLLWDEFLGHVKGEGGDWQEKTVEAAVKCLNESGVIVYIHREFPVEWGIPYQRLVILNPNWFCREIVGNMFVPTSMRRVGEDIFREKVDSHTGSIPISVFKEWLEKVVKGWDKADFEKLKIILLWSGLCYLGRKRNVFIPSLASEGSSQPVSHGHSRDARAGEEDWWDLLRKGNEDDAGQWVMGYSLHRAENENALAPIALWHKFQVELAQTSTFNGPSEYNCFITRKYSINFRADSMAILIKVDADLGRPTFEAIKVYVKPLFSTEKDNLDLEVRKQWQVDLAYKLVEILTRVWIRVCPRVEYVKRIVWPFQTFNFNPQPSYRKEDVEVDQVKCWVEEHGVGTVSCWTVGTDPIMEDQLLSTSDKELLVQSFKQILLEGREDVREGMAFCGDVLDENSTQHPSEASTSTSQEVQMSVPSESASEVERFNYMMWVMWVKMDKKLDLIVRRGEIVSKQLDDLMREKRNLAREVRDVGRMFLEANESSCPRFIHLATKSGSWMTLKKALSTSKTVHVHFACEAKYKSYGQHIVEGQRGIEVSELKPWAKKALPWLRVSLTLLCVSAKLSANVLAPGLGLILPDFPEWTAASSLAQGLHSATGFSKDELVEFMKGQVDFGTSLEGMKKLCGSSRVAMTVLLGKLEKGEYEKKLGMRKVHLLYEDRSSHVVWICNACFEEFEREGRVTEL